MGNTLAYLGLLIWTVIWSICLFGRHVARKRFKNVEILKDADNTDKSEDAQLPGVSILRPLRGLDANLYDNLQSSFQQDYPKFEIIFSVANTEDPAIPFVRTLIQKFPDVDARLIIGQEVVGINPKVNNLVQSYRQAKYDILWVLDSNSLAGRNTLRRIIPEFSSLHNFGKPIGMLHHVPFPVYPDVLWGSRLEYAFLSMTHAKMYLAINACNIDSCIVGKSNLYHKSDIERTRAAQSRAEAGNGLAAFSQYLGEDNMIGRAIWHDLGMRHAMNADVIGTSVGSMTLSTYFWRRVRWIRVRKYMVIASTLLEPLTESILCGLIGSTSLAKVLQSGSLTPFSRTITTLLLFLANLLAWFKVDQSVYKALLPAAPLGRLPASIYENPSSFAFFQAWLLREALALPIWLFAMLGNTVVWRDDGTVYRVSMSGQSIQSGR